MADVFFHVTVDRFDVDATLATLRHLAVRDPRLVRHVDEVAQGFNALEPGWVDTWYEDDGPAGVVLHVNAGPKLLDLCARLIGYRP